MVIKNKRGWIKIVEAVIAIILLSTAVILVLGDSNSEAGRFSSRIHEIEISILRDIQLDSSLRAEVLGTSGEVEWGDSEFPGTLKAEINNGAPSDFSCEAKICAPGSSCLLSSPPEQSIYTESVIISSTISAYNPRLLKIFCWET